MPRLPRRPLGIALLACLVPIPALAGCEAGLNAPTVNFHPAANGATATGPGITINNAFVLGPAIGQSLPAGGRAGLFLSVSAVNQDQLLSVSAPGYAGSVKLDGGAVSVAKNSTVNLTGPAPRIVLTNLSTPLQGGQTVTLALHFATAGDINLQVPVEPNAYDYATYAQPPTPAPSPSPSATGTHHAHAHASASASPSATP